MPAIAAASMIDYYDGVMTRSPSKDELFIDLNNY